MAYGDDLSGQKPLPSCVSISSTSASFCWGFTSFLRSWVVVTWFMLSGGVFGAPVLSLTPELWTLLFFFITFPDESLSAATLWYTVLCELCELFLVPETVVNLTKCLLAMRPMSAVFYTLNARAAHKKHIYDVLMNRLQILNQLSTVHGFKVFIFSRCRHFTLRSRKINKMEASLLLVLPCAQNFRQN